MRSRRRSFRPLTTLTFRWTYLLGELDPAPYHVGNIVLHALASVLVAELASRIVPGKVHWASLARQSAMAFLDGWPGAD
jgi:hypothetical protein